MEYCRNKILVLARPPYPLCPSHHLLSLCLLLHSLFFLFFSFIYHCHHHLLCSLSGPICLLFKPLCPPPISSPPALLCHPHLPLSSVTPLTPMISFPPLSPLYTLISFFPLPSPPSPMITSLTLSPPHSRPLSCPPSLYVLSSASSLVSSIFIP